MAVNPIPPRGGPDEPMEYPPGDDPRSPASATAARSADRPKTPVPWQLLVVLIAAAVIIAVIVTA